MTIRPLIPRTSLFGNPTRASVNLSPDGQRLAWLAPDDGVLNIWVAEVSDLENARVVTQDRGRGIRMYDWAPDNIHMLYVQDEGGDENWHIHAVNLEAGDARNLTPVPGAMAVIMATTWVRPGEMLVALNDRDPAWHDTWHIDIATGERTLHMKNEHQFAMCGFDEHFRPTLMQRTLVDGGRELLQMPHEALVDGHVSQDALSVFGTFSAEDAMGSGMAGQTHDGATTYLVDSTDRDTSALFAADMATGARTLLAEHPRADILSVAQNPVDGVIEGYSVNHLRLERHALGDAIAADIDALNAALPGGYGIARGAKADDVWVVASQDAQNSGRQYLYDRASRELTFLFDSRPELAEAPLKPMYPVIIPARDDLELVSYLTLPGESSVDVTTGDVPAAPDVAPPMVLIVHGGPWARDAYGFNPAHQWLADRGYSVLSVNFRGSTGFGKAFRNAGKLQWGRKMHDDLLDAVDWAVANGFAAREKVAIYGGSYGGYATLAGLTFTPDVFACGVDIVGPSNLETLLATVPPYWAAFFEQLARNVGDPRTPEGVALLKERSPVHYADQIARPLLIGQGANDPRVKQDESDQIVNAMTAKGLPVTYVLFPDEGHGFARPDNRLAFNAISEAFLAAHLGGSAEPIGDAFDGSSLTVPTGADDVAGLAAALDAAAGATAATHS